MAQSGVLRIEAETCDGSSQGTGFLIGPRLVATVEHVIDGASSITLKRRGRVLGRADVIGSDPDRDLALLRMDEQVAGHRFAFAERAPKLGEGTVALGYPLGLPLTLTRGAVSGLHRRLRIGGVLRHDLVQTDAAVNPGNSGGPLLSETNGAVVGLMDLKDEGASGIGFAVSSAVAKPLLDAWIVAPQPVAATTCASVTPTSEAASPPAPAPPALTSFDGRYFSASYPESWLVDSAEVSKGSYIDTTITAPNDASILLRVDVTPGADTADPSAQAQPVVDALRHQPGYELVDFTPTAFAGLPAVHWEFLVRESGVLLHKEDVMFTSPSGDDFAVLTQAPAAQYRTLAATFAAIRGGVVVYGGE